MKIPFLKAPAFWPAILCSLLMPVSASAAITYSDVVDIPIPITFNGIYLNLEVDPPGTELPDDADVVNPASFTQGYTQPADWDVNFFFGGIGIAYSPTFRPFVDDTVGNRSQILNVSTGTVISSEAASRTLGVNSYGGSGRPNGGSGDSHFDIPDLDSDPFYSAFTPGQAGHLAFVLNPGASERYGWMKVTLTNDGSPGFIHEWAYSEDVNFTVGQIPEPGSLLLWLMLAPSLILRRRRRQ